MNERRFLPGSERNPLAGNRIGARELWQHVTEGLAGIHALLRGATGCLLLCSAVVLSAVGLYFVWRAGWRLVEWIDLLFK